MQNFDSFRFEQAVKQALVVTQQVLGTERKPQLPSEVHHQYQDKFALVEAQLSSAAVCSIQALQVLGLTQESLKKISDWANAGDSVSIRFNAETKCDYSREAKRDVEGPKVATETSMGSMISKVTTTKVVTTVTEYFWTVQSSWSVEIFRGTGSSPADVLLLSSRTNGKDEVKTAAKSSPFNGRKHEPFTISITWLAKALDRAAPGLPVKIRIDRTSDKCLTPRRNNEVEAALAFASSLQTFSGSVSSFVRDVLLAMASAAKPEARVDISNCNSSSVFLPAILFEAEENAAPSSPTSTSSTTSLTSVGALNNSNNTVSSVLMDLASLNRLLNEAASQLSKQVDTAKSNLPNAGSSTAFITDAEARVLIACSYLDRVLTHLSDGVNYAEKLLRDQVVAAVGKYVQPSDFDTYMRFHSKRLFKQAFEPKPLCFSVRRSAQHTPEGTLRIDDTSSTQNDQIFTISAQVSEPGGKRRRMMDFGLTAETRVQFGGEVHLHAWLSHRFSADPRPGNGTSPYSTRGVMPAPRMLSLVASARQFSSFVLLVGKISSPTSFDPVSAIIIKDKDEISIPLALSEIPTPKEFKDAIASLSPEQQRFCKAFRAMQLESTLFGVLVLHIKPQLEVLMNLAPDALTKEVELTQHLMDLFIQHQIPADLLSAPTEGPASVDAASKLAAVKANVAAVKSMISKAEDDAIKKREKEEKYIKPVAYADEECVADQPQPQMRSMMRRGAQQPQAAMMAYNSIPMAAPMMAMMDSAPSAAPRMMMMKSAAAPPPPAPSTITGFSGGGAAFGGGAAVPTPAPAPVSAAITRPQPSRASGSGGAADTSSSGDEDDASPTRDLTQVPSELDKQYELHDADSSLRATIIAPEGAWTKKSVESILSKSATISTLNTDEQKTAKSAAFDLLDALSRSGGLPLEHAALHVVMGATHTFDESLIDTVVTNNMNPIEKSERSMLIMASTLHNRPAYQLVRGEHIARLTENTPALFLADQNAVAV